MTGDKMTVKAALYSGTRRMSEVFTSVYDAGGERQNLAVTATDVATSSDYDSAHDGWKAADGNKNEPSRWATPDGTYEAWLELTFAEPITVDGAGVYQYNQGTSDRNIITNFNIEYWDGGQWIPALEGQSMGDGGMDREWTGNFEAVTSDRFRLNIVEGVNPTVYEFELYKPEETQTVETDKTLLQGAIAEAEEAIESGQTDAADADLRESFMTVYDYALAVNENAASSQDTIDRTYNALTEEIRKLDEAVKPVSKTILELYLNEAKAWWKTAL